METKVPNIEKSQPIANRVPVFGYSGESPFARLRSEMDQVFNQYFGPMLRSNGDGLLSEVFGSLDLVETDNAIDVTLDVPGVDPQNVDIKLVGDQLLISGHREEETSTEEKNFHRMERSYGSFHRKVTLPCEVSADKVEAELGNGVLKIRLPKSAETKQKTRKIKIKTR